MVGGRRPAGIVSLVLLIVMILPENDPTTNILHRGPQPPAARLAYAFLMVSVYMGVDATVWVTNEQL
jgi:hypothetical protein